MQDAIAVATIGKETYRTELRAGKHVVFADEPSDVGGKDLGPRPEDLLRMALASCTAITLRMYANRKGFDISEIQVAVSSVGERGKTRYQTNINISGQLTGEQRNRMLQIAKLCPVHKVLTHPIELETSLAISNLEM